MHFGRNGPRLTQLVECLTVVGKHASLADIRMSPVQVRERGPILPHFRKYDFKINSVTVLLPKDILHKFSSSTYAGMVGNWVTPCRPVRSNDQSARGS